jgi:glycosyltransferase involved in cell wall biosynthesis
MKISAQICPSLIISAADNPVALDLVLEAVSLQTRLPFEVLVVDDGSDEQTKVVVEKWRGKLPIRFEHFSQAHEFFRRAAALNAAVRHAYGNYLIFIDGDCLPHRHFVEDHLKHAQSGAFVQGRRAGIRARYVRRISPSSFHPLALFLRRQLYDVRRGLRRPWPTIKTEPRRAINGCNFSVWREDFYRVNGYNEAFVGEGLEDTELAERLVNSGLISKTVYGQMIVYHLDHPRLRVYRVGVNERILEQTRREKIARCERGVTLPSVLDPKMLTVIEQSA